MILKNFSRLWDSEEVRKKVLVTIGLVLVYKFLSLIPVPGVNISAIAALKALAEAPQNAAWLSVGFCGVPAGPSQFNDTIRIEVLRNGMRAALSAPFPLRQDASGIRRLCPAK